MILALIFNSFSNIVLAEDEIIIENLTAIYEKDDFETLASECASNVHVETLKAIVKTESNYNPFAIGVVNGKLNRQPKSLKEALLIIEELEKKGLNYSIGLAQINKFNFEKYGETAETLFEPCNNLKVGSNILENCYDKALKLNENPQIALLLSLSCYYSGNFKRGFKAEKTGLSYVETVQNNVNKVSPKIPALKLEVGVNDEISLSSEEAVKVQTPASTPTKTNNNINEWIFTSEEIVENEVFDENKNSERRTFKIQKKAITNEIYKSTNAKNNILMPGEFVLIVE